MRLLLVAALPAAAQQPDTVELRGVVVRAPAPVARVHGDGALHYDSRAAALVPRTLGEADAMRYLRLLPGINATSDISSSVIIDGSDNAQNIYRLNGIPVHFPYHFGGIFSVFNSGIYPRVVLRRSMRCASSPDYLGGTVDVCTPRTAPEQATGRLNAGMLASTVTLTVPVRRVTLSAGARVSYLDLLYGGLLAHSSGTTRYNFHDIDLSACWRPGERDAVELTFHANADRLGYGESDFAMDMKLHWNVLVAGAEWRAERGPLSMSHRIYRSEFHSRFGVDLPQMGLLARARFGECGAEGRLRLALPRFTGLEAGYSLRLWDYVPQWAGTYGIGLAGAAAGRTLHALAAGADASLGRTFGSVDLTGGLRLTYYRGADRYGAVLADPHLTVSADAGRWHLSAQVASASQYVHQVGLSEIGLASNFRIAADSVAPPQRQWSVSLAATGSVLPVGEVAVEGYCKFVGRQAEYAGSILDMTLADYSCEDFIWTCRGYSAGANVMASYSRPGPLSGSVSYGFCHARRRRYDVDGWFTASSEIAHSLKADLCWRLGRAWELSATFNLSSGRPYTPITAVYLIGERVMMDYGARNSARMPAYQRLDIGAAYRFRSRLGCHRLSHRIDVSVLNVLNRSNVEMYAYTVDMEKLIIRRREIRSLFRMLPSLSYEISF